MPNLTRIYLSTNGLTGKIPVELSNHTELLGLDLSQNKLEGGIPPEFGRLTNLRFMSFANNRITGPIPDSIGNLSNLTTIDFYGNGLTGSVPISFGNLLNLRRIWLDGNQLSGNLDFLSAFSNCRSLNTISMANNTFTGSLPAYIGNLSTVLETFIADNNRITFQVTHMRSKNMEYDQCHSLMGDGAASLPPPPDPPPAGRSAPPRPAREESLLSGRSPEAGRSPDPQTAAEIGGFLHPAKWKIFFQDVRDGGRRSEGVLYSYYPSRWTVVRDLDSDILGGEYLKADEEINEGTRLLIDVFDVTVHSRVQEEPEILDHIDLIDLTEDPKPSKPLLSCRAMRGATSGATRDPPVATVAGRRRESPDPIEARVGGRFWALADSEDDEDDDVPVPDYSPTPSDVICEAFKPGFSEEDVAALVDEIVPGEDPARLGLRSTDRLEVVRRIVHRRTAATAIRPWKGPLPKVLFRTTALIRSWSLLTQTEAREHLVTGSVRWEMVARDIFNRFGWRSCNRIGI
ncbi:hypothetical protein VPH35_052679 [Triticum aestivum]|uniref:uncharacterized protein n=1 Tax=Triticum aestivum TaxID=4565 RepID=UPI001D022887|nr:uncharacterized protein LOC123070500 [Triticum aestivum]